MVRIASLLVALLLLGPAATTVADETITSDTVGYCNELAARMAQQDMP